MRRILQVFVLAACISAALARPASAAGCGDGIIQAGEQCDPASGAGQAPCPGRCLSLPNLEACQCATVSSDPRDFAAIADLQVRLAAKAAVTIGGVAVVTPGGFLSVGAGSSIAGEAQAIADRCRLMPSSSVGRLFCNDDIVLPGAFIGDGGPFSFTPPASFPSLPPFSPGSGGGSNVIVTAASTQYLAPGAYGNLIVEKGATLVLHGLNLNSGAGRYDVLGIKVIDGGALLADNPVVVNVKDSLRLTGSATLMPTPTTSVQPGDFQIEIEKKAKLGKGGFVAAHVRAPNGKITVGRGTTVVGQLIGQKIAIQKDGTLQAAGGCGDGVKQATEMCDTSAAGGDGTCPGECIPVGEAGQCTCECDNNSDCNNNNACDGVETCDGGHCAVGTPPSCNDNNPCTRDCNPATGCVQVPIENGTRCEDGNECTRSDACQAGVCQSGELRTCSDGNDCTTDSCDPASGCKHVDVALGAPCSDGDLCSVDDACIRGACIAGNPANCNDTNPCTTDSCDPLLGSRTPRSRTTSPARARARARRSTSASPAAASRAARRSAATATSAAPTPAPRSGRSAIRRASAATRT